MADKEDIPSKADTTRILLETGIIQSPVIAPLVARSFDDNLTVPVRVALLFHRKGAGPRLVVLIVLVLIWAVLMVLSINVVLPIIKFHRKAHGRQLHPKSPAGLFFGIRYR